MAESRSCGVTGTPPQLRPSLARSLADRPTPQSACPLPTPPASDPAKPLLGLGSPPSTAVRPTSLPPISLVWSRLVSLPSPPHHHAPPPVEVEAPPPRLDLRVRSKPTAQNSYKSLAHSQGRAGLLARDDDGAARLAVGW
nr:unnamed protein product [Digitaria exilis]